LPKYRGAFITTLLFPVGEIPGLRINIEQSNGLLLASVPHDELKIGKQLVPAIYNLKPDNVPFLVPPKLMRTATVAMTRHTLYPDVQVTLTLDLSTAMADWARDRNRLLIVVAAAGLLVLALAGALYAAMRQRERVEAERMNSRETLDNAIESMSDGFVMWDEQDRLITCNQRYREKNILDQRSIHRTRRSLRRYHPERSGAGPIPSGRQRNQNVCS
jgi:PAS domain-containing protein